MHHIIFTVERDFDTGDLILDTFITYSDKDAEKIMDYFNMLKNPLWEVTSDEASRVFKCDRSIPNSIYAMSTRCRFNTRMKIGHMITESELSRKHFENYIKGLKYDKKAMLKFMSSLKD